MSDQPPTQPVYQAPPTTPTDPLGPALDPATHPATKATDSSTGPASAPSQRARWAERLRLRRQGIGRNQVLVALGTAVVVAAVLLGVGFGGFLLGRATTHPGQDADRIGTVSGGQQHPSDDGDHDRGFGGQRGGPTG